jgi:C4-dicarboxylate transporter DctM subunit
MLAFLPPRPDAAHWVLLGCVIDSISIILPTLPIFAAIATHLGFDPLAFAIIGILAVETGLLTPPFGILVFTVKASVPDKNVDLAEIFRGSIPYWIILLLVVTAIALIPEIATVLPRLKDQRAAVRRSAILI